MQTTLCLDAIRSRLFLPLNRLPAAEEEAREEAEVIEADEAEINAVARSEEGQSSAVGVVLLAPATIRDTWDGAAGLAVEHLPRRIKRCGFT